MRLFLLSGLLHLAIALRLVPALPLAGGVLLACLLLASAVLVPMGLMAGASPGRRAPTSSPPPACSRSACSPRCWS